MRRTLWLVAFFLGGVLSFAQTTGTTGSTTTFPRVVATFQRCGLTEAIPTTTIFTPTKTGYYRISIYTVLPVDNGGQQSGDWDSIVSYHDLLGIRYVPADVNAAQPSEFSVVMPLTRINAGTPVQIYSQSTGDVIGAKYDVTVVIEQLK